MTKYERIQFLRTCSAKQRREYYGHVADVMCIICGCSASVHHAYGTFFPAKREHRPAIPLCYEHHQGRGGIHNGKSSFEDYYGSQDYLLLLTEDKLDGQEAS